MSANILIVEDDKPLQKYLKELLLDNGYSVTLASDGVEAIAALEKVEPDLVVLDLGLPKISGESVCREIRERFPQIRVIILTAKDSVADVVQGLQLGADDYMTKPFVADVFLARIEARLRRMQGNDAKLTVGDLVMDTVSHTTKRGDKEISLTPQEYKLLHYMMMNKGRVLTRDMILNRIWLFSPDIETRVVDVYVGYVRKKIDSGFTKKLIQSVRGFGYVIKE
jgi:DNA-binding response OmpR family regulator